MPIDLFSKTPIKDPVSAEMQKAIDSLRMSSSKEECLERAYDLLAGKYAGDRLKTYTRLYDAFRRDAGELWSENGYLHCTNMNYLLRILLTKSGFFSDDDIRLRWTFIWFISPHQYAQVRIEDRWIDIDVWAKNFGIEFGDHAHGFH